MIKKFNIEKTRQLDKIDRLLSLFFKKPKCDNSIKPAPIRNILIVDFALIGDMVMNIPFLRVIRENCSNAEITMVCMPWAETVLADQGLVDRFIIFDGKNLLSTPKKMLESRRIIRNALREINQREYEVGIEPKGDLRHIFFMHYTRSKRTVSYNYTGGNYLITDSLTPKQDTKHLIDEKLDLLEMIGWDTTLDNRIPELKMSDDMAHFIQGFKEKENLTDCCVIGVHPGASNINKQYRHFPELACTAAGILPEERNVKFLVFEGPNEAHIVDEVCNALKQRGYLYCRVKEALKKYISLVSLCEFMICNDSAAAHIAAAYGANVLVIFGPVKSETACPRGSGKIVTISHEHECKPCTLPICRLGTEACIRSVTLQECENALKRLMDKGKVS